ncbi:MAG TPA: M23 family metallopeptidase, partial [Saprospiraceae bacterium]|nr:M23 family metallopeptidase [Saprospiraceae bacterium]
MNFMRGAGIKRFKPLRWVGVSLVFLSLFHFSFPAPDFSAPLGIDLRLSGTFGELRSNHFHAGIDLKSPDGQSGTPVVAAADGFIHRVKVKGGGYGQALYIDHGNGYSTVYAHLDAFTETLDAYVRKEQYRRASFTVDLFPRAGQFQLKKGDLIGYMGNSGHSYGPHLHFEIRRYGIPVNPLAYLAVPDETRPVFRQLY